MIYEITEVNAFIIMDVVKAACYFTVHCKHITAVNRKSNQNWHFDDKSTCTPIRSLDQLFVYEVPCQRSSKNVGNHSADIIGPLLTSTAKSHSIYGMIKLIAADHWVFGIK